MPNKERKRYSSVSSGTPREGQDLRVPGEGESTCVDSNRDDDILISDGGSKKQRCRYSYSKKKKGKSTMNIGTWNVRTMKQLGKLRLLIEELKELKMTITGICETRWDKEGLFKTEDHTIVFSGSKGGTNGVAIILDKNLGGSINSHDAISDRIVTVKLDTNPVPLNIIQVYAPTSTSSEEEIEQFYNDLQALKDKIPAREMTIIMGDFNAKVGEGEEKECGIGPYGLGLRNDRGDMLASFCRANDMTIANTMFNHPKRRRYTWIKPGDTARNQIDYILVDNAWKTTVLNAKTYPGADCETDHILVTAKIRMKFYKRKKSKPTIRFDTDKLKDPEVSKAFRIETENRFSALLKEWSAEERYPNVLWEDMKKIWTETAEIKLGRQTKRPQKPYISEEVIQLAKRKSKARKSNKLDEYITLKKEIQAKVRRDKNAWLESECAKITESNAQRKSKEMFEQIKKVKHKDFQPQNLSMNSKEGKTINDTKDVLIRWHEYGKTLFEDEDKHSPEKSKPSNPQNHPKTEETEDTINEQEPKPLLEEIKTAIKQLKYGKSPGLDGITGELLKHTSETGVKALHHLCCKIWESCEWPTEWKLQEFVMLYKSGNRKECGNYRTISLISHTSKVLLIIILNRMKLKVEEELSDCQAGYRTNRGTTDMLFTLQIIIEQIKNSKEEAFITFIDYSKAFDSVKHHHLFNVMTKMGFPKHLVKLIYSLYEDQRATIRWNNEHSPFFNIEKGVRQGCILSPHLFSIYTEQIMRDADIEDMGVKIGGRNITNLRYADDTALLADNITSMKRILHRVDDAGKKAGLHLNAKKTKVMKVGKENAEYQAIQINKTALEKVSDFKYLGSYKTQDGNCSKDIRTRIGMSKNKMIQLNNIWKDRSIPTELKMNILKCLIWPVLLYGSEAWTLRQEDKKRLMAAEMWLYRRLLRISWTERRTNESILNQLGTNRKILSEINKRRLRYIGHTTRNKNTNLMSSALYGRIEAGKRRGRPSITYQENIREISGLRMSEIARRAEDRADWRRVVTASEVAANIEIDDADR